MELMYPFTGVSTLANPSFSPKDRVGHIEIVFLDSVFG